MTKRIVMWLLILAALGQIAWCALRPAHAQQQPGTTTGLWSTNGTTALTINAAQSYTINVGSLFAPYTLTLTRSKDCSLVVLEDSSEKMVIGCRKEFK